MLQRREKPRTRDPRTILMTTQRYFGTAAGLADRGGADAAILLAGGDILPPRSRARSRPPPPPSSNRVAAISLYADCAGPGLVCRR